MTPGIEVFGRGATIVEVPAEVPRHRRSPWLGIGVLLLAILTAVLTGLGVGAGAAGDEGAAQWLAIGAIAASILSVLLGLLAVFTARGRLLAGVGIVLAIGANPWILLRVLEFFSGLVG